MTKKKYTQQILEGKTVNELKQIVRNMGIVGVLKKRKDIIIDSILNNSTSPKKQSGGSKKPSSKKSVSSKVILSGSFTSESIRSLNSPFGYKSTSSVRVVCGVNSKSFDIEGLSIYNSLQRVSSTFNVDLTSVMPVVNGKEQNLDYIIKKGDELEFVIPSGSKSNK